jgi:nitrite reductase/ring-hydroxylating ferredoxin subunit
MSGPRCHRLVGAAALSAGELRRVSVGQRELVLVNDGETYFLLDGRCTHKPEALLAEGLLFRGAIICPWHGYRYDVRTGRNVHPGGARALGCVPVRIEGSDLLLELP